MRWTRSEPTGAGGQGLIPGALPQGFQLPVSHRRPSPCAQHPLPVSACLLLGAQGHCLLYLGAT